jgi:DNA-binding transcriptional MerR regulator
MMVEHARALERSLQQMHADADAGRRIFGAENARLKESLLALEKDARTLNEIRAIHADWNTNGNTTDLTAMIKIDAALASERETR